MSDVRIVSVLAAVSAVVALVLVHALLARWVLLPVGRASPQKFTAGLAVALNLLWVPLHVAAYRTCDLPQGHAISSLVYVLIIYNAAAYAYFHFFNMSETARRIRMLIDLLEGRQAVSARNYGGAEMVEERLRRLQQMGQIELRGERWYLRSAFLLRIGRLVQVVGVVLCGRRRP